MIVRPIKNLADLYDQLICAERLSTALEEHIFDTIDFQKLPTFGGDPPKKNTDNIISWDENKCILINPLQIVKRCVKCGEITCSH